MSEPETSDTPAPDLEQLELKLPGESSSLKDLGLWAGALVLLTLIVYWPATTGTFIWRDDATAAKKELLAPPGLAQSWFARWQDGEKFDRPVYQPITDSAYWIEYRLGGHDDHGLPSSTAFHIAGLIFHVGAAVLLWLILRELLVPGAWLIAGIFAMHPIHTEPVSWISEQGVVLSGMLFLGSFCCYLMFVKSREADQADRAAGGAGVDPLQTWGLYSGAAVLSIAAVLSAPGNFVLPIVIALALWWKRRFTSQDSLLLLPLLIIGLVFWFANFDLHKTAGEVVLLHAPVATQLAAVGRALWHTGVKLILPFGFSSVYSSARWEGFFAAIAAIAVLKLIACYMLKDRFGTGLFVVTATVILLVGFSVNWFDPSRLEYVTDGTSYLAIAPLIALVVVLLSKIKLPGPQPQTVVGISAFALILLGGLAWKRTYVFASPVAQWRDMLDKNPGSSFASASLAEQLRLVAIEDEQEDNQDAVKQDLAESIQYAGMALQLDPKNAQAQRTWANVLVSQGDIASAVPHFEAAKALDLSNADLRNEYASSLIELGRFKEAIPPLDEALMLDVNSATSHRLLGQAYEGLGNSNRAIKEMTMALESNPGDVVARQKLAEVFAKTGKYKEAIANYERMMEVDQAQMKHPELWQAIARIKDKQGAYATAVQYLQTAQALAPDDADIKKELDAEIVKQAKAIAATQAASQPVK